MLRFKSSPNLGKWLASGRHDEIDEYSRRYLLHAGDHRGRHFKEVMHILAKSEYFRGQYARCSARLRELIKHFPNNADLYYLLADSERLNGHPEGAWSWLEKIAQRSQRLKTWLYMAQLVSSEDDLGRFKYSLARAQASEWLPAFHPHLQQYVATAHQYAGDYATALRCWQYLLAQTPLARNRLPFGKARSRIVWRTDSALKALRDLKSALENGGVEVFLISGTLLGAIREGKLLPHDNDVDVGIWATESIPKVRQLISRCGFFHLLPQREGDALRVKHVNGMAIDVFRHHKEGEQVWHGGIKVRWYNQSFSTTKLVRLGSTYSVPDDYERYLSENYNNWRIPKPHFDSTLDTPNAFIMNDDELAIHCFKKKYLFLQHGQAQRIKRYDDVLKSIAS